MQVRLLDEENEMSQYGSTETGNGSKASLGLAFRENLECVPGPRREPIGDKKGDQQQESKRETRK
jgi:hypothetical protein